MLNIVFYVWQNMETAPLNRWFLKIRYNLHTNTKKTTHASTYMYVYSVLFTKLKMKLLFYITLHRYLFLPFLYEPLPRSLLPLENIRKLTTRNPLTSSNKTKYYQKAIDQLLARVRSPSRGTLPLETNQET